MTFVSRLLRFVGHGSDAQLARARTAADKWKARADRFRVDGHRVAARLDRIQQDLRTATARAESLAREMPSVSLLRATFVHRLRTLRARTDPAAASLREAAFLRVSPAYRSLLDAVADDIRSVADQVDVDGVRWWVPSGDGPQRLPYRGILQTREVATGGIMLDLGANIGRMAISRAILGDVTAVYCAEPDPVSFACMARTVVDNGLRGIVLPEQLAIGDNTGTVPFLREGSSGNFHVLSGADAAPAGRSVVEVPCCTLDEWISRLGIDLNAITFIKVDVEGFERRVVAGARRALACRHIAWQMEIKPAGLRGAGDAPEWLYDDLQQSFTHFIDLNRHATGRRMRPVGELREALAYVEPDGKTDVLLFTVGE